MDNYLNKNGIGIIFAEFGDFYRQRKANRTDNLYIDRYDYTINHIIELIDFIRIDDDCLVIPLVTYGSYISNNMIKCVISSIIDKDNNIYIICDDVAQNKYAGRRFKVKKVFSVNDNYANKFYNSLKFDDNKDTEKFDDEKITVCSDYHDNERLKKASKFITNISHNYNKLFITCINNNMTDDELIGIFAPIHKYNNYQYKLNIHYINNYTYCKDGVYYTTYAYDVDSKVNMMQEKYTDNAVIYYRDDRVINIMGNLFIDGDKLTIITDAKIVDGLSDICCIIYKDNAYYVRALYCTPEVKAVFEIVGFNGKDDMDNKSYKKNYISSKEETVTIGCGDIDIYTQCKVVIEGNKLVINTNALITEDTIKRAKTITCNNTCYNVSFDITKHIGPFVDDDSYEYEYLFNIKKDIEYKKIIGLLYNDDITDYITCNMQTDNYFNIHIKTDSPAIKLDKLENIKAIKLQNDYEDDEDSVIKDVSFINLTNYDDGSYDIVLKYTDNAEDQNIDIAASKRNFVNTANCLFSSYDNACEYAKKNELACVGEIVYVLYGVTITAYVINENRNLDIQGSWNKSDSGYAGDPISNTSGVIQAEYMIDE